MSPKPTIRQLRVVCIIYRADGCRVIWEFKDEGTIRLAKRVAMACRDGLPYRLLKRTHRRDLQCHRAKLNPELLSAELNPCLEKNPTQKHLKERPIFLENPKGNPEPQNAPFKAPPSLFLFRKILPLWASVDARSSSKRASRRS